MPNPGNARETYRATTEPIQWTENSEIYTSDEVGSWRVPPQPSFWSFGNPVLLRVGEGRHISPATLLSPFHRGEMPIPLPNALVSGIPSGCGWAKTPPFRLSTTSSFRSAELIPLQLRGLPRRRDPQVPQGNCCKRTEVRAPRLATPAGL